MYRTRNTNKTGKPRPVLRSLVSGWKKNAIMRNKKKLKEKYLSEDYSKETLKKITAAYAYGRKEILPICIKYDQLIIKENTITKDKRKRKISTKDVKVVQ